MRKRLLGVLLVILFVISMTGTVFAENSQDNRKYLENLTSTNMESLGFNQFHSNPMYPDYVPQGKDESGQPEKDEKTAELAGSDVCYTMEEAGSALRKGMVSRASSIVVSYDVSKEFAGVQTQEDFNKMVSQVAYSILAEGMKHTGNGREGDYLVYQYAGYTPYVSWTAGNVLDYQYDFEYYDSAEDEREVDEKLAVVEQSFGFDEDTTDYEKILDVYDYIRTHVVYDYAHVEDNTYYPKWTAHAALLDQTAVCQGYANLFYRMSLDSGVDARIVAGVGQGGDHSWNIVELDGKYYYLDATWDSQCYEAGGSVDWFLKGSGNFPDHTAGALADGGTRYVPEEISKLSTADYNIPLSIRKQPINGYAKSGDIVHFGISALGTNLTYTWYYRMPGNSSWQFNTTGDFWGLQVQDGYNGVQLCCVVSDGKTPVTSDIATIYVESYSYGITEQPEHTAVNAGETATFHVAAAGRNPSYQWQVLENGAWTNLNISTAKTSTLQVVAKQGDNRKRYRCVVTDRMGNVDVSNEAILAVLKKEEPLAVVLGHKLNLSGSIGVNYYIQLSDRVLKDGNAKVVFSLPNNLSSEMLVKDAKVVMINNKECREFGCKLHSSQMTGGIQAKVVLSDGTTSEAFPYTVKEYADIIIKNENNSAAFTKVTPLVKSMLNYGGYAQTYFKYDDSPLANKDLTAEERNAIQSVTADNVKGYKRVVKGTQAGLTYEGSTLVLTSETCIRHFFSLQSGRDISEFTFRVEGKTLTPVKSGSLYYVEIPDIASGNLDTNYTVSAGGITISYSALSYVYAQLSKENLDADLANTLKALYLYNQEANLYFNK